MEAIERRGNRPQRGSPCVEVPAPCDLLSGLVDKIMDRVHALFRVPQLDRGGADTWRGAMKAVENRPKDRDAEAIGWPWSNGTVTEARRPSVFGVKPGRVYEFTLCAQDPTREILTFAEIGFVFVNSGGEPLDPRLFGGSPPVPELDPTRVEILPAGEMDDALFAAGESSRFVIAPPDAVELRVAGLPSEYQIHCMFLRPMGVLWSSPEALEMKSNHEAIAAERVRILRERLKTDQWELHAIEAIFRMPLRQIEALEMHFQARGDWAPILAMVEEDEDRLDCRDRLSRLRNEARRELKIGFVGSERGYERLAGLARVIWIRQDRMAQQIAHLALDLVVIETSPVSGIEGEDEEWALGFSSLEGGLPTIGLSLFRAAEKRGIPVHLWMTCAPENAPYYSGAIAEATAVIAEGTADEWAGIDVDRILPRATEPTACSVASQRRRQEDLMLVPVASDILQFPDLAELVGDDTLYDILVCEFRYRFHLNSLAPLLPDNLPKILGPHTRTAQRTLLQAATLVLLSAQSVRDDADLEHMALDAIASGAIPVLFGNPRTVNTILDRLDRVFSATDLAEIQSLYRVEWFRERRWRELFRLVMREHVWRGPERGVLLGCDPFVEEFDEPKVSVVLSTRRPHLINRSLETFRKQTWRNTELILVLNTGEMPPSDLQPTAERATLRAAGISQYRRMPQSWDSDGFGTLLGQDGR